MIMRVVRVVARHCCIGPCKWGKESVSLSLKKRESRRVLGYKARLLAVS